VTVVMQPQPDTADLLLEAGLADLVEAVGVADAPASAEVVALLAQATALRGGRELRAATLAAADRLQRSLAEPLEPGLAGSAGSVWALVEAARAVDDKALGWRALSVAAGIPVRAADPGIAHGVAGTGMAQLRLWLAYRDRRAAGRVRECVDVLVRGAQPRDGRIGWAGGEDRCGFADGLAGIGAFLLAAGRATGSGAALRTADAVAATLHLLAVRDGGAASWPGGDAAGVGTFLARHAAATGDARSRELAVAAAFTTGPDPLATGQLRLDLGALLGEDHGRPARLPRAATPQALSFLLRLRHGGPRPWLAGDLEQGLLHPR
jgi:Lanthionine synthetase C-like protein